MLDCSFLVHQTSSTPDPIYELELLLDSTTDYHLSVHSHNYLNVVQRKLIHRKNYVTGVHGLTLYWDNRLEN